MSERIGWEGWCSLEIPAGWDWSQEGGTLTIFDADGVGALRLSFATRDRHGAPSPTEAMELADAWNDSRGWAGIAPTATVISGCPAVEYEYVEGSGAETTF